MKTNSIIRLISISALLLSTSAIFAGGGGLGGGVAGTPGLALGPLQPYQLWVPGGRGQALTDLELTAIARAEESFQKQIDAVTAARETAVNATFVTPLNPADLNAKLQVLASAELQNALAQAEASAKLLVEFKGASPAKLTAMTQALGNPASAGLGGGGGAGGAPAAPAPRAGGAAGAAPVPAAPRAGN